MRGKYLRDKRQAAGITQVALAARISELSGWRITQPRLSDIESEAFPQPRRFSRFFLEALAQLVAEREPEGISAA